MKPSLPFGKPAARPRKRRGRAHAMRRAGAPSQAGRMRHRTDAPGPAAPGCGKTDGQLAAPPRGLHTHPVIHNGDNCQHTGLCTDPKKSTRKPLKNNAEPPESTGSSTGMKTPFPQAWQRLPARQAGAQACEQAGAGRHHRHGEQVRNSWWINAPYTHLAGHAIDAACTTCDTQLVGCTAYGTEALYAVFHKISHLI